MKILLDAMGGDNSPDEMIKGAVEAIPDLESEIILIGDENVIKNKVKEIYNKEDISEISPRLKIKHASEVISNEETPTEAIKTKKDSSMVVGFQMLKNGEGDVFVSAGSTGAFMAGGLLQVGRIKGVDRPALCPMLPTYDGKGFMLIDCGANTNCRPINLVQFAKIGSIYMQQVEKRENPKVGLLNIGAEESKGNDLLKESYAQLKEAKDIHFYGNVEGRYIFDGDVDIVVADGFTGNITLKVIEGMGATVNKMLKEELYKTPWRKFLAFLLMPAFKNFKKRMDYSEYGGALLLGINKPMVKCHGSAKAKLVKITLLQAEKFAKNKVVESIQENIDK
ncbi:MAG: phosphate acyltransferase PlsX [Clostridia bacterium]|nr:phosphate acyltransferase PlsX [Clostridia bacterium]